MQLPPGIVRLGDREVPKNDLVANAARIASGLRGLGIRAGDTVMLFLRNDFAFVEALLATNWIGVYVAPVNWHNRGAEVKAVLHDARAAAIVVHADMLPEIRDAIPEETRIIGVETTPELAAAYRKTPTRVPDDAIDWADLRDKNGPVDEPYAGRFNIIYTSGTTALPKGAARAITDPTDLATAERMAQLYFGLENGQRAIMTGPMYHSAPFSYMSNSLVLEGDIDLMPRFDAEDLLRRIDRYKLTHMHMVPTMFSRLLRLPDDVKAKYDLSSLKHVVHGAAPCPPAVKQAMIEWWGPVIWEYYGSTETSIPMTISSEEWLRRPGSVGKPFPHSSVEVRGPDGRVLGPGEEGEIYIRLSKLTQFKYRNRPETHADTAEGKYMSNGDIGYFDADGYLYLCDRVKDMIISGGVNIFPSEIEAVICEHPAVKDCAVFGIPDPEFGEAVAAAVERDGDVTEAEIQRFVAERLAKYKMPKRVDFHDSLPREDSGKIFKRRLRDPFWEGHDSKI